MDMVFYEFSFAPLEKILPKLLEKIYDQGQRIVIFFEDPEYLKNLNTVLWTYSTLAFLPHGSDQEGWDNPKDHPIWLTTSLKNENEAQVGIMTYGAPIPEELSLSKGVDLFHGRIEGNLDRAQERQRFYASKGYPLIWWRQTSETQWEKKEGR